MPTGMPTGTPVKLPCLHCKEKHVKCDDQKPKCRRCAKKNLECLRPTKATVFRHDANSHFARDQQWVKSEAKRFRFDSHTSPSLAEDESFPPVPPTPGTLKPEPVVKEDKHRPSSAPTPGPNASPIKRRRRTDDAPDQEEIKFHRQDTSPHEQQHSLERHPPQQISPHVNWPTPIPTGGRFFPGYVRPRRVESPTSTVLNLPPGWTEPGHNGALPMGWSLPHPHSLPHSLSHAHSQTLPQTLPHALPHINTFSSPTGHLPTSDDRRFPLVDIEEACLMRYYIEEIAHWLDLADPDRHFQLRVPVVARSQPHLLNAIFAVAARHLIRMPQYKDPRGIINYHGQLLPNLDPHSAVEYMLKCIPALRRFHDGPADDEFLDSVVATAVLLRQLEEIDDDDHEVHHHGHHDHHQTVGIISAPPPQTLKQVNFLPIIDAVLRSAPSQALFSRRTLIQAAYWMALRQEIYHSFTRKQAPQMILAAEYWVGASCVNKSVMHTVQVLKWRWGDGSYQEWDRLVKQQEHLEQEFLVDFKPIFHRPADKSKGEIFPTVWYGSNIEVTSIQQAIMAKSVLTAENPNLHSAATSRAPWRQVENEVRSLILELCGIALCHPASPPALLHTVFVVQLYQDYFTDKYERQALRGVVERYRDTRAWPSRALVGMFEE